MIRIAGSLVNPVFVVSAKIESRDYMNGSTHWLVVRMADGSEIRNWKGPGPCDAANERARTAQVEEA